MSAKESLYGRAAMCVGLLQYIRVCERVCRTFPISATATLNTAPLSNQCSGRTLVEAVDCWRTEPAPESLVALRKMGSEGRLG